MTSSISRSKNIFNLTEIKHLLKQFYRGSKEFLSSLKFIFLNRLYFDNRFSYPLSRARKVVLYKLFRFYRLIRYLIIGRVYSSLVAYPEKPYFYYPLHFRPESSTLTLGRHIDDDFAIDYIARLLPIGSYLVVKENKHMIPERKISFYRKLQKYNNVILVDSSLSSSNLILNSLGVLSVSGTALLEASILGKPSHALGNPEFENYLTSHGLDSLENFLLNCVYNKPVNTNLILAYLDFVLYWSICLEFGDINIVDNQRLSQLSTSVSEALLKTASTAGHLAI